MTLGVRRTPHAKAMADNKAKTKPARLDAAAWPQLRARVLKRDDFSCRYCGFRAEKFQRVHITGGAAAGDVAPTLNNLATACIFCEQCFELESVAGMASGILIWLPELTQIELHHMMRALYIARSGEGDLAQRAQIAFDGFFARRAEAKRRLGTEDALMLATALIENMDDAAYAARGQRLDGIRLLPLPRRMAYSSAAAGDQDQFPHILEYWRSRSGPFGPLPVEKWDQLFKAAA